MSEIHTLTPRLPLHEAQVREPRLDLATRRVRGGIAVAAGRAAALDVRAQAASVFPGVNTLSERDRIRFAALSLHARFHQSTPSATDRVGQRMKAAAPKPWLCELWAGELEPDDAAALGLLLGLFGTPGAWRIAIRSNDDCGCQWGHDVNWRGMLRTLGGTGTHSPAELVEPSVGCWDEVPFQTIPIIDGEGPLPTVVVIDGPLDRQARAYFDLVAPDVVIQDCPETTAPRPRLAKVLTAIWPHSDHADLALARRGGRTGASA